MKAERGEETVEEEFETRNWFMKFKERNHLSNIKVQGEAASPGVEVAASYSGHLAKKINEGRYMKQQIFLVEETVLCWKKTASKTFIAREKSIRGFKASRDRLTLTEG